MINKMISLFVCSIFVTMISSIIVTAGDENNPEIKDNIDDQFGALISHPERMRTHIALWLLQMDSFDFIDIDSAWFYEQDSESEYLYASLKIKDLEINSQRAIYSIHWTFKGIRYAVGSHLYHNGKNKSCFVGLDKRINHKWNDADVTYDFENNIVTFKMDKKHIGNPLPGEVLTRTYAWTALRFYFEPLCLFFSDGELVKDGAPFIKRYDEYGLDYIIQY